MPDDLRELTERRADGAASDVIEKSWNRFWKSHETFADAAAMRAKWLVWAERERNWDWRDEAELAQAVARRAEQANHKAKLYRFLGLKTQDEILEEEEAARREAASKSVA
jgi:hypothetical protein